MFYGIGGRNFSVAWLCREAEAAEDVIRDKANSKGTRNLDAMGLGGWTIIKPVRTASGEHRYFRSAISQDKQRNLESYNSIRKNVAGWSSGSSSGE